jgi:hypothetical protein
VDVIVSRCAGLDVHKDTVMACVRTPSPDGGRRSTVRRFRTFTASLRELRDWLVAEGVTQVAMEATGVYWKPVWHVLDAVPEWELLLANAHAVKNLPGRKTDLLTELPDRSFERCARRSAVLARFRPRDQRRGRAAGVLRVGGAAARLA